MTLNDSRIQCFCFDEQLINPGVPHPQFGVGVWAVVGWHCWTSGEEVDLPIFFFIASWHRVTSKKLSWKISPSKVFVAHWKLRHTWKLSGSIAWTRHEQLSDEIAISLHDSSFLFFFLIVQWICRSKTWELSSLCLEALWPYRSHHLVLPFLWVWLGIAGGVRGAVQKVERTGQTLGVELPQLLKNLFLLVEYFTNLQIC